MSHLSHPCFEHCIHNYSSHSCISYFKYNSNISNPTKRHQIESPRENRFIGRVEAGESQREAARHEDITHSSAHRIWKKYCRTGTTHNQQKPGRPALIDDRGRYTLVKEARKNRRKPFRELGLENKPQLSTSTVRRELDKANIHRCVAKVVPNLTDRQRLTRRVWARHLKLFKKAHWRRVVWSDESYIHLCENRGSIYVSCTPDEK